MTKTLHSFLWALPLLFLVTSDANAQCEALHFDGTNDIATVLDTNNDFDMGDAMTLEAWFQVDVTQVGAGVVGGTTGGGGGAYMLTGGISNPDDGGMVVSTPSTDAVFAPGAMIPGPWLHMAGTFDGTDLKIYVNGAPVASKAHTSPGTSSDVVSLVFGRFAPTSSNLFFNGTMDELRLWNVVRTPAEILATYDVELVGDEPGLVGYYKFEEGGGDVILDSSVKGNDGFLGGTAGPGTDDPSRVPSGIPFGSCLSPGTAYCFGDPGAGAPCPCGNQNDGSVPGSGCANGVFASGAQLSGSGQASVSADALVLATTGLEPNNSGLYFQANNDLSPGLVWGDGLQCAGGTLKRLGVRFSDGTGYSDTSGYPLPISVKAGNVMAGDTKHYQCWYRNIVNSPCSNNFNASNGYAVVWAP